MTFEETVKIERLKLWSRVFADAMNGGYLNERHTRTRYAKQAADAAVEQFDLHVAAGDSK
jgi:hypothetical protein